MRRLLLPLLLLAAAGCATSGAFRAGENAERLQDYDRAVLEYQRAVQGAPDNVQYRRALERARMRASTDHTNMARRLSGRGLYNEALNEYRLALELKPDAPGVAEEMRDLEARREKGAASLQEAKVRARERALPGLDLGPDAQQPLGLVFRGASLREAYLALGRAAGINVTFDPSFRDEVVSLDLKDVGFDQALNALAAAGRTFHRVVDPKILNVVPDTVDQAAGVRAAGGQDALPLERRPQGDDRPPARGARRPPRRPPSRARTPSPSTTPPTGWRRPSASSRSWTSAAPRSWSRSRSWRSPATSSRSTGSTSPPGSTPRASRGSPPGSSPTPRPRARATVPTTGTTWWSRRSPARWCACWRPTPRPGSWPTPS